MGQVYDKALEFKRKHPGGVVWNLKDHCNVVEKHLNPGEYVTFAFAGQKNDKFYDLFQTCVVVLTNKRILIGQKRVVWGYFLSSITPDLYNDLLVYQGLIWGQIKIDTIKEEEEEVKNLVKDVMENVIKLDVTLKVGIAEGKDLYEAK